MLILLHNVGHSVGHDVAYIVSHMALTRLTRFKLEIAVEGMQWMQLTPDVDLRDWINLQLLEQDHYNHPSIGAKKATERRSGRFFRLRYQQRWRRHGAKMCKDHTKFARKQRSLCNLCFPTVTVEMIWYYNSKLRWDLPWILWGFHDYHLVSHIIWKCCVFSRANSVYFFCFCDWLRWLKILLGLDQNPRKHREPQGDTGIPWEYNFVGYLSKTEYRNRWYMVNCQKWSSLRHTNLHRLYQWRCATMHFVSDHWNSDPCQNVSHIPHAESEWVKAITTTFRSCWLVRFALIFFNGLGMFEIDVTSSLEIESASNDWP